MAINSTNITHSNNQLLTLLIKHKHNTTYDFGNHGSRLGQAKISKKIENTIKPVLCDLPKKQWNMVTWGRWSLNTGLIDMKCTIKGKQN